MRRSESIGCSRSLNIHSFWDYDIHASELIRFSIILQHVGVTLRCISSDWATSDNVKVVVRHPSCSSLTRSDLGSSFGYLAPFIAARGGLGVWARCFVQIFILKGLGCADT